MFAIAAAIARPAIARITTGIAMRAAMKAVTDIAIGAAGGLVVGAATMYFAGDGKRYNTQRLGLDRFVGDGENKKEVLDLIAVRFYAQAGDDYTTRHDVVALENFREALQRFESKHGKACLNLLLATLVLNPTALSGLGNEPTMEGLEDIAAPTVELYKNTKSAADFFPKHKEPMWDEFRETMARCLKKDISVRPIVNP